MHYSMRGDAFDASPVAGGRVYQEIRNPMMMTSQYAYMFKSSLEADFQRIFKLFIDFGQLLSLFFFHLQFTLLLSCLLSSLLNLTVQQFAPGSVHRTRNPWLYFYSGNALHPENFEGNAVSSMNSIRYSLDVFIVLTFGMLYHGVNGWKFFGAFGATKMFGFLVVV